MKKSTFLVALTGIICAFGLLVPHNAQAQIWDGTSATDWSGDGSATNPFIIITPQQLAGLAEVASQSAYAGKYFELGKDLDMSNPSLSDDQKPRWTKDISFNGHFDGKGHSINNLFYGKTPAVGTVWEDLDEEQIAVYTEAATGRCFFYSINGTVQNLTLKNPVMTGGWGYSHPGFFAQSLTTGSRISNCHVEGGVFIANCNYYTYAPGFIASVAKDAVVENCSSSARVVSGGNAYAVGFVGGNTGTVRNCSFTGRVYTPNKERASGFIGLNSGLVEGCFSTADVKGRYMTAGFVSHNEETGTIRECYASGNVYSTEADAAGFCAENGGFIETAFSAGSVSCAKAGSNTASFILDNSAGKRVINCFASGRSLGNGSTEGSNGIYAFAKKNYNYRYKGVVYGRYNSDSCKGAAYPYIGNADGLTTNRMKSRAFVDTLNVIAVLCGLSAWEYREGDYPMFTRTKATGTPACFAGGTGKKDDPYLISNKTQLEYFRNVVNMGYDFDTTYIRLTADIVLNRPQSEWGDNMPDNWEAIGNMHFCAPDKADNNENCRNYFKGNFDGGFHTISNLFVDNYHYSQGLFGYLTAQAHIRNLGITDAYVTSMDGFGILGVAASREGDMVRVTQCWTSGTAGSRGTSSRPCGILYCGDGWRSMVKNSYSHVHFIENSRYGYGITNSTKNISNCYYNGNSTAGNYPYEVNRSPDNYYVNADTCTTRSEFYRITTAYMQSKGFVNELNYNVLNYNAKNEDTLLYWKHSEGGYPSFSKTLPQDHTITYVMNGAAERLPQPVIDGSYVIVPPMPFKDSNEFIGWYTDAALTQHFLFDSTPITHDYTLYAKWAKKLYPDYTPFRNTFTNTYIIKTPEQLAAFSKILNGGEANVIDGSDFSGKTVKLGADIVLNDTADYDYWGKNFYARNWMPASYYIDQYSGRANSGFAGTFDGDGHTIYGLFLYGEENQDTVTYDYRRDAEFANHRLNQSIGKIYQEWGLFAVTASTAVIKNVTIRYAKAFMATKDKYYQPTVGFLVGHNQGKIENCHVGGEILRCYDSKGHIGLLAGRNAIGISYAESYWKKGQNSLRHCSATGKIELSPSSSEYSYQIYYGGLVGIAYCDTIENCSVCDVEMDGGSYTGGLAGITYGAHVINCTADNVILHVAGTGREFAGGLVGNMSYGSLQNCKVIQPTFDVQVKYVGGFVGSTSRTPISDCHIRDLALQTNGQYVGGIAGYTSLCKVIKNCSVKGSVSGGSNTGGILGCSYDTCTDVYFEGEVKGSNYVGGICGQSSEVIRRASASGSVQGKDYVGGLLGGFPYNINKFILENSYCTNRVEGNENVGGLVGHGLAQNCYTRSEVKGNQSVGGLIGYTMSPNTSSSTGIADYLYGTGAFDSAQYCGALGKIGTASRLGSHIHYDTALSHRIDKYTQAHATKEMKTKSIYEGFDFDSIWGRKDTINDGYPYLRWQYSEFIPDDEDPLQGIRLVPGQLKLDIGGSALLQVASIPSMAKNNVTWRSADEQVAVVSDSGWVKGLAQGYTYIYATDKDGGFTDSCRVAVGLSVAGIDTLIPETASICEGDNLQLTYRLNPAEAVAETVSWQSSNDSYLTVDENGLVTAVRKRSSDREYTVTLTVTDGDNTFSREAKITIRGNCTPYYTITVRANNDQYGTVSGSGTYEEGSQATLTASAAEGYRFVAWDDESEDREDNPRTVTVYEDAVYTAVFEEDGVERLPSPVFEPEGGEYWDSVAVGIRCDFEGEARIYYRVRFESGEQAGEEQNEEYSEYNGEDIVIRKSATVYAYAAADGWHPSRLVQAVYTITETPAPEPVYYTLTVHANDSTMGSVSGSGTYKEDTVVKISATPSGDYVFKRWSDGSFENPRSIRVTQDTAFTAVFGIFTYTLTVTANDTNWGTVTGGGEYEPGDMATLTATAREDCRFRRWSDGSYNATRNVVVVEDATYTAIFEKTVVTVTVKSNDSTMGTVTGGGKYPTGSIISISATPNRDCEFIGWEDGESAVSRIVTVNTDTVFTALFRAKSVAGENRMAAPAVKISPNPSSGLFRVAVPGGVRATVVDESGRTIARYSWPDAGEYEMNLCGKPAGLYLLKLEGSQLNQSCKLIIR